MDEGDRAVGASAVADQSASRGEREGRAPGLKPASFPGSDAALKRRSSTVASANPRRRRAARVEGGGFRPSYEWTRAFERLWAHQLLRIKERADGKEKDEHRG